MKLFTYLKILILTKGNYLILQFVLPVLIVSIFDPTLETVRFPLIYYSFLGYLLSNKKLYSNKYWKVDKYLIRKKVSLTGIIDQDG